MNQVLAFPSLADECVGEKRKTDIAGTDLNRGGHVQRPERNEEVGQQTIVGARARHRCLRRVAGGQETTRQLMEVLGCKVETGRRKRGGA